MQEKIKTSNKIPIEQVEKIIRICIEYMEATRRGSTQVQIWQKLESIESLAKDRKRAIPARKRHKRQAYSSERIAGSNSSPP